MENDSIRASGTNTLVDIWVDGKLRAICVTKDAVETFLGAGTGQMTEEARCEFVRTHLSQLAKAVKAKLRTTDPAADMVVIEAGQLAGMGERRKGDRRKTERRKTQLPASQLPHGERRRGERRQRDRRQRPPSET